MPAPTRRISNEAGTKPRITWGNTAINEKAEVSFDFGCFQKPLRMERNRPVIIGRAASEEFLKVDLDLTDCYAVEKGVSRQHLMVEVVDGDVIISDLNSTNGTYLNGRRLSPQQPYVVRDGDEIRLGALVGNIYF